MKKSPFRYALIVFVLLAACGSKEKQLDNLPIVVTQPESQAVDLDTVISNAHNEVKKVLPDASLNFFSLATECKALSELKGDVRLHFSQTQWTLFGERVFTARVVVDTAHQTLSMKIEDETEQDLITEPLELSGMSTLEIARILEEYLESIERCNDIVVLARGATIHPWYVRCGPPDEVFITCIEIDPETGTITERK